MNVLFQRGDRLEKQVRYRLPVYLHEVGDLFVVHAFKVFEEDSFLLAAGQLLDGTAYFDLIFAQQFVPLNFGFDCLIIGDLAGFVDVEEGMRAVAAAEFLHELIAQCTEEVDGNELDLNVLTSFPDVDHQVLNGVFDEFPIGSEVAGVIEQRAVLFVGELAKCQTVPGLALVPEI